MSTQGTGSASHLAPLLSQLSVCLDLLKRNERKKRAKKKEESKKKNTAKNNGEGEEWKSDGENASGILRDYVFQRRVIGPAV